MSRPLLVAMCAAAVAFAIAFVAPSLSPLPVAWYYPVDGGWSFDVRPSGLAIDFYGRIAQACLAWAIVFVPLRLALRRRTITIRMLGLATAWMLTATLFAMLFYAWTLHFRIPMPLPSP